LAGGIWATDKWRELFGFDKSEQLAPGSSAQSERAADPGPGRGANPAGPRPARLLEQNLALLAVELETFGQSSPAERGQVSDRMQEFSAKAKRGRFAYNAANLT